MKGGVISAVVLVLIIVKVAIRIGSSPDTDEILNQAVKGANQALAEMKKTGDFKDAKCYRDGANKGLVFEYVFSKISSPESMDGKLVKSTLKQDLGSDSNIKKVADYGIYFRYIYKSFDGKVLCNVTISPSDLKN